jgi:DNA-binding IclR family transcriptional regulator
LNAAHALVQLSTGFIIARAIYLAAKLGIADLLGERPSASELAKNLGVNPDALFRILRLLASAGILKQTERDHFSLTELGSH